MLNIQNNYNLPRQNMSFKSNLGIRLIRNIFFCNCEKRSIDKFTREMSIAERNNIILSQAHVAGIKPLNMIRNLYSNVRAKLIY